MSWDIRQDPFYRRTIADAEQLLWDVREEMSAETVSDPGASITRRCEISNSE